MIGHDALIVPSVILHILVELVGVYQIFQLAIVRIEILLLLYHLCGWRLLRWVGLYLDVVVGQLLDCKRFNRRQRLGLFSELRGKAT